eukprot:TRINITY_DN13825_c0_g1_i6.p1 TRINITY_DN13825_c0_g1~~TRINITY_DN13825_c0_g1_i6.p1  ORF type:complete len:273 (+),score=35.78 TRINITY_DN13825_c0_g1_i6:68-820(+)
MADFLHSTAIDLAAATLSAGLVAPFVAACDKAIAEAAAGQSTVWASVGKSIREMSTQPVAFLRGPAFRCLWIMYGGTYAAANMFRSYEEKSKSSQPLVKTSSIFVVNCSLSLWKDSQFAKLFSGKPPAPIPKPALASWYLRDFCGMAAIFTAPPILAKQMQKSFDMDMNSAEPVAQIACSLAVQPMQAPFHLHGYVLYNDPQASLSTQWAGIRNGIWGAVQMRFARCIAPYCVGTNLNTIIRKSLNGNDY